MLEPAIQSATAQSERLGGLAHIAAMPVQRLSDQQPFNLLEWHVIEHGRDGPCHAKTEIGRLDLGSLREECSPLNGMIELAHVSRPGVRLQRSQRFRFETHNGLSVPPGVALQEVLGEYFDVLPTLTQRRQANLDRIQAKEQVLTEIGRP